MIKSMTGYGRAQAVIDGWDITVEIKTVNHRYFEFSARLPRAYGFLEERIKANLQSCIARGKVDVYIALSSLEDSAAEVVLNHALAAEYIGVLKEIAKHFAVEEDISASMVSRYPDVLTVRKKPENEEAIWNVVRQVLEQAASACVVMREAEGTRLCADVKQRAEVILQKVSFVESRSPETTALYAQKLEARIKELMGTYPLDEQRILTEVAIMADRTAVAEETVRLRSHLEQLGDMLASGDAIGRKLDFLVQEINREANTVGSKAQDVEIARAVVDIKAEIEKIREQIQNIE